MQLQKEAKVKVYIYEFPVRLSHVFLFFSQIHSFFGLHTLIFCLIAIMHSLTALTIFLSFTSNALASAILQRALPVCVADNCLRAVTGTQPGQTQTATNRIGDCSSFMIKTVTPDTV